MIKFNVFISEVLRRYFDKAFWPRHPTYLAKLAALSSDKTPNDIAAEMIAPKKNAFKLFHLQAISWINDWGNDCRKRE